VLTLRAMYVARVRLVTFQKTKEREKNTCLKGKDRALRTYVKIHGPPLGKALDELQKIARKMPKVTHYHFLVGYPGAPVGLGAVGDAYPIPRAPDIGDKVTHPLISKSGHTLGDYDFFFEWNEDPTWKEMRELIAKIDKSFTKLRCKYTLTTK